MLSQETGKIKELLNKILNSAPEENLTKIMANVQFDDIDNVPDVIWEKHDEVVKYWITKRPDLLISENSSDGDSVKEWRKKLTTNDAIHKCLTHGNTKVFESLINDETFTVDNLYRTCLNHLNTVREITDESWKVMEFLLEKGVDPTKRGAYDFDILSLAIFSNNKKVVGLLLDKYKNVFIPAEQNNDKFKDYLGYWALGYNWRLDMLELLIEKGVKVTNKHLEDVRKWPNETHGKNEIIELLTKKLK